MMNTSTRSLDMSSLAAAAIECRLNGKSSLRRKLVDNKQDTCSVRVQGDLLVRYLVRPVALGPKQLPPYVRKDTPRTFDKRFDLYDPDTFFRSYSACLDAVHHMLMQTPFLCDLDLGADNWDAFVPHEIASFNVATFRRETLKLPGVALRYNVDITLTIYADILYDEPKALLLACMHAHHTSATRMPPSANCSICMEEDLDDLAAAQDTVSLQCSHSVHRECIGPWFYKAPTCPVCRRDVSNCLVAVTNTPRGNFPGLSVA